MKYLNLNEDMMVLKTSNSFGDQILALVDLNGDSSPDSDFPYHAGSIVKKETFQEGSHEDFTADNMHKVFGL